MPTRTTNRIHFEDLHDRRFEDLCLQLIYRSNIWDEIHHDGRVGSDDGVDIRATELLQNGARRNWFVQCRRYKKAAAAELKKAVDDTLEKTDTAPDILLVIVACDVSLRSRTSYENYARKKGITTPKLWAASLLEAKLYSDFPDLLFTFFGISLAQEKRTKESFIKRNLVMKRKVSKVLRGFHRGHNIIIRSIDDDSYPEINETGVGRISGWFKTEFEEIYHDGIEIVLNVNFVVMEKGPTFWDSRWSRINPSSVGIKSRSQKTASGSTEIIYDWEQKINMKEFDVYKTFYVGRIPYRNIIEIDEDGDEYGGYPHFYCNFSIDGMPYSEFIYKVIQEEHVGPIIPPQNEVELKILIPGLINN